MTTAPSSDAAARTLASQTPKKILVVDDDQPLCKMSALALKEGGYRTFTAFSGVQALEIYRAEQPDVIVLDVAMPGMSGFEVVSEVRKSEPPGKHTIIVIMTAYAQNHYGSAEVEAGIDSFLTKPVLPLDLIAHVSSLIG